MVEIECMTDLGNYNFFYLFEKANRKFRPKNKGLCDLVSDKTLSSGKMGEISNLCLNFKLYGKGAFIISTFCFKGQE